MGDVVLDGLAQLVGIRAAEPRAAAAVVVDVDEARGEPGAFEAFAGAAVGGGLAAADGLDGAAVDLNPAGVEDAARA